ncbi:MAG: ribonuclease D [Lysobacterales bacterium]|nr:MAG: ribonuclease D [Xanthomonadales bacterium]
MRTSATVFDDLQHLLSKEREIEDFLAERAGEIALDSEFQRERSFHPKLALVQLCCGGRTVLIDTLALPRSPALIGMLTDRRREKLMHAPGEDLETFAHALGALPEPLFDTQIAAALAGLGHGLGYAALVWQLLGIEVAKDQTRSDWLRRPLSSEQLRYAAEDVRHLPEIAARLRETLGRLGRLGWLEEECQRMVAAARGELPAAPPHHEFTALAFAPEIVQRRLLRILLWRENRARARDLPQRWLLSDESCVRIAYEPPSREETLLAGLGPRERLHRSEAKTLLAALSSTAEGEEPFRPIPRPLEPSARDQLRRLSAAVAALAAEHGLPPPLLAPRRWLEAHLRGETPMPLRSGWRSVLLASLIG